VSAIAELEQDRVVEGVYAVARKERLRTRGGASYLAVELVDPSGRIEGRVWSDVDLLDSRFAEGDAVRILGRVDRFRDRLQLEIRSLEPAEGLDPAVGDDELRGLLRALPATLDGHHGYAGGLLEHTVGVATICREVAQLHPRLRSDLLLAAALLHDVGRTVELTRGPVFRPTDEGKLLGHVHLGLRLIEERAAPLEAGVRVELLHAVGSHHDARAARTAEAAVLYHANRLDAVAATRPVPEP
jgi:3'-5' exoribonuclease